MIENKIEIEKLVEEALKVPCVISAPLEHYTIGELTELSKMARDKELLITVKYESSNFYVGTMVSVVQKELLSAKEYLDFI